MKFHDLGDAL